jgi:hypothetical protein
MQRSGRSPGRFAVHPLQSDPARHRTQHGGAPVLFAALPARRVIKQSTELQPGIDELVDRIAAKKAEIDRLRDLAPRGLRNLEHVHDLESPHTSNAIEGNTLTAAETVLVVEQEIVIGGKPLKDHLEAVNHYDAIRDVRELAPQGTLLYRNGLAHSAQLGGEAVGARDRRTIKAFCVDQCRAARFPLAGGSAHADGSNPTGHDE